MLLGLYGFPFLAEATSARRVHGSIYRNVLSTYSRFGARALASCRRVILAETWRAILGFERTMPDRQPRATVEAVHAHVAQVVIGAPALVGDGQVAEGDGERLVDLDRDGAQTPRRVAPTRRDACEKVGAALPLASGVGVDEIWCEQRVELVDCRVTHGVVEGDVASGEHFAG